MLQAFALYAPLGGQFVQKVLPANYNIQLLWETAVSKMCDTEMKARIRGIASKFLCISLSEMILRHTDKLSKTLQQRSMSSVEGHTVAMLTVSGLNGLQQKKIMTYFGKSYKTERGS